MEKEFLNDSTLSPVVPRPFELHLLEFGVAIVVLAVVAIMGNVTILVAILRHKTLQATGNKLIWNLTLADFIASLHLAQVGVYGIVYAVKPTLPVMWMNQLQCLQHMGWGLFALTANSTAILAVSVDRLIAILWPFFYQKLGNGYVASVCILCWAWAVLVVGLGFAYANPVVPVPVCLSGFALNDVAFLVWNRSNIAINVLVAVVYLGASVTVFYKVVLNKADNERAIGVKALYSYLLIVSVYLASKGSASIGGYIVTAMNMSMSFTVHFLYDFSVVVIVNIGCNFFILFWRSAEFNAVFRKIFAVVPVTNVVPFVAPSPA